LLFVILASHSIAGGTSANSSNWVGVKTDFFTEIMSVIQARCINMIKSIIMFKI